MSKQNTFNISINIKQQTERLIVTNAKVDIIPIKEESERTAI